MRDLSDLLRDRGDDRLLRAAQRGDREAFRRLYRRLHPIVWAYVARRAGRADAEDVVARVFEQLVARLSTIDPSRGGARAFVLGVARNAVIDLQRRQQVRGETAGAWARAHAVPDPLPAADEHLVRAEVMAEVEAAFARLPESTRELFVLRFGDGFSCSAIARLVGLSEATVKQRFSRALRELRQSLTTRSREEASQHG